jgi:hypothetical protein
MTKKLSANPRVTLVASILDPTGERAPSTVYEDIRRMPVMAALAEAGLVGKALRDTETGRKVGTILRELGRLNWGDLDNEEDRAILVENYKEARDMPIDQVKEIVRLLKRDGQGR